MSDAEVGLGAIEERAQDVTSFVAALRADFEDIQRRVAGAREIAKYMFDHPEHHTTSDVEQKAGQILEWLEGI